MSVTYLRNRGRDCNGYATMAHAKTAAKRHKTLEEKRRNFIKLDAIYPKRWAGDNIDGSIKQDIARRESRQI